jgi:uncharacterized membrane protein
MARYRGRVARLSSAKAPTAVRICSVPRSRSGLAGTGFLSMLTKQDEDFILYWSQQRTKKKQFLRKISIGLPLGVFLVVALMINFLSGWYLKADMELHSDSSVILVVLVAAVAIVVFIVLFSARLKWDQNEQHYLELIQKKDEAGPVQQVE